MKDLNKRSSFYLMMAIFGGISLSILVFFALFRLQGIGDALKKLTDVLAPFTYGCIMAYLLRPVCNFYQNSLERMLPKGMKRASGTLAVGLSLITGILVVYTLIIMIAPQLYNSARSLWDSLPDKFNAFLLWARTVFGEDEEFLKLFNSLYESFYFQVDNWAETILEPYISSLLSFVSGVGTSLYRLFKFLYNLLIGMIVACYLLAIRKQLARQSVLLVRSCLKPRWADLLIREVAFIDEMFGGFIDGKILDSAIIGLLCYIGCMIFKFPNALLVSVFIGITNVIPFFGPFIGAVPATFLIMIEDPIKGLWFIVFILALQQLDGNVIGPKILGDRTGLSSFWVLFSIVLFGGLWGVAGMLICVPLFAVIYDVVKKMVRKGLAMKGQFQLWEEYKNDYPDETQ